MSTILENLMDVIERYKASITYVHAIRMSVGEPMRDINMSIEELVSNLNTLNQSGIFRNAFLFEYRCYNTESGKTILDCSCGKNIGTLHYNIEFLVEIDSNRVRSLKDVKDLLRIPDEW